ncbi:sel1 repeat family protein [Deefgea tanakiae]|uniref:Sel1 repeat family protein n=1 Tax=Deefgea tanakiae TaxID=2865840 RepID=A0ABX8Z8U3_9NEIS|nr:tetratricopeptide repeat protein [Deefgea tanakiae]QZA78200.1 sel1 repeat family protein [Deefgea tanakiae]
MKRKLFTLLLSGLISTPASAGYDEGIAAYNAKNYRAAFSEFSTAADQGNPKAQLELGKMYAGYNYKAVQTDYSLALKWLSKAASKGLVEATYELGQLYEYGNGVRKNVSEARRLYIKAAEQGNTNAMNSLGKLYIMGSGVPINYSKAASWNLKGAELGDPWCLLSLSSLYDTGDGVPKNFEISYALLSASDMIFKSKGNDIELTNDENKNAIAQKLSPKQLTAARRLATELVKPHNVNKAISAYLNQS